jgi:hypothetical protein
MKSYVVSFDDLFALEDGFTPSKQDSVVYLAADADARIAELERTLALYKDSEFMKVCARVVELEQLLSVAEELFQDECDIVSETDSYLWLQDVRTALGKEGVR